MAPSRVCLLAVLPLALLGLRRLLAERQHWQPDFVACENERELCGGLLTPSRGMGTLLEHGSRRMRSLAAAGRTPLALHIGADTMGNKARWADKHLYIEVLARSGLPAGALSLAFVEPLEQKKEDFWHNVKMLPVDSSRVSLVNGMVDGECRERTRSLWGFSPSVGPEFGINFGILGGWTSADPNHARLTLESWVDTIKKFYCQPGVQNCAGSWRRLRHLPNVSDYIQEFRVPCLTPADLLAKLGVRAEDIAMLVVDAEGFDVAIIEPLARDPSFRPGFVMWERVDNVARCEALRNSMRHRGYEVGPTHVSDVGGVSDAGNIIAVLPA
uniref:Methyltransferase FkbM domain-containing protein n=1 Tax=Alexandrium monilatum TaxID=311494 RepID=A0A7S4R908_9DINO